MIFFASRSKPYRSNGQVVTFFSGMVSEKKHALGTAKILSLSLKNCSLQVGEEFNENALKKALFSDNKNNSPRNLYTKN